jgi:hypothetical protein
MAQSGYTPISLYYSSTTGAAPTAGQLVNGELGINITDGKLYYKDNSSAIQSFTSGSGSVYDVQTFTSSGTWTKPAGVNNVQVVAIGGGGGGSSGRKGAIATNRSGGAGAAGGMRQETIYAATFLPSTVSVTIGSGGAGGVSVTTNSTNGNIGTAGGNSTFGSYLVGSGGFNGLGVSPTITITDFITGQLSQNTSGTVWINAANAGASYGGLATSGGPYASFKAGNGGGGGSISSANALGAVGYGSAGSSLLFPSAGGNASAVDGSTGSNGTATTASTPYGGGGGGGGQASLLTNAGAGGNGALYGGGGGGGGASVDSLGNSGAGGNGADGIIVVISW